MKTIHKLFLIATIALGLGFVACSDSDVVPSVDESKANTHVSVSLKLSKNPSVRSAEDYNYVGEWAGQDKIETIAIYLVDGGAVTAKTFSVGPTNSDYKFEAGSLTPARENAAIKTTAGPKEVYVLINGTPEVVNHLAMAQVAAFEASFKETALALANSGTDAPVKTSASKIAGKNGTDDETIVMTSVEPGTLTTVEENVTAAETIAEGKNRVSVEVERAVARVMVTIANKTSFDVKDVDDNPVGTVTNVTWVLAQGENKLYVQRKSTWETPSFGWVPTDNAEYIADAGGRYDYSGLFESRTTHFGGTEVATMASYAAATALTDISADLDAQLSGKFILPTTHEFGSGDASKYKKGNTPYVLIRAQFTPEVFADGGTYTTGDDFFVGANGKFYTSATNALTPATGGVAGQTVARYVGGKVLYYAWLNPDNVAEPYNSPVLRNNIYHIHITGFKNLGTNWNPLFPEVPPTLTNPNDPWHPVDNPIILGGGKNPDPKPVPVEGDLNYPDPTDPTDPVYPNEPENPIDPEGPLTTPVTYMSVDVTVLPWNVHSYPVDLGM